jgi:hypothetical protein
MKKFITFLIVLSFNLLPLKAEENDLLSGYQELIKSTVTAPPASVNAKIEKTSNTVIKNKYEWLVFVFINGVNDLGALNLSLNDINEMETVGSNDRVAVVVEHNRIEKRSRTLSFSNGAVTHFITKDSKPNNKEIVSIIIDTTTDGDMGSYRHFARSAKKAIKKFNPDKVVLIIWNHGNGYFGISYDDVSGNSITVPQLRDALSDISKTYGKKIDIFAMDACLMQMAEVVAELKDYSKYIVASEEEIPGAGFPYDDILGCVNSSSNVRDVSKCMVVAYDNAYGSGRKTDFGDYNDKTTTLSSIETSKFSEFLKLFNKWISIALKSDDFKNITDKKITEESFFFLGGIQKETLNLGADSITTETENVITRTADLVSYLKKAKGVMKDEELKSITETLINYISKNLVALHKGGDSQNSKGLSYKDSTYGLAIYLPLLRYDSKRYEQLRFSKICLWDEFLKKMLDKSDINDREEIKTEEDNSVSEESPAETEGSDSNIGENSQSQRSLIGANKSFGNKGDSNYIPRASLTSMGTISPKSSIDISQSIKAKPSIYSTRYSESRTLKPDMNSLMEGKNNSEVKNVENKSNIKANEVKGLANKSIVEKTKDSIKNLASNLMEKSKDILETIFPDKEKRKIYQEKLKEFEIEITKNMNITYSKKLVEDPQLKKEFSRIDSNKTNKLVSYATELIEIDRIVSRNYEPEELNSLSKNLETILDRPRLICELGLCIPPEKLSQWMSGASKYQQTNISNVEIAIRKWDKIFTDPSVSTEWGWAGLVKFSSTSWSDMSVKERNAALDRIIKDEIKRGTTQSALISLSDRRTGDIKKTEEVKIAIDKIADKMLENKVLSSSELSSIRSRPIAEQMYILSNLFDRGGIRSDASLSPYISVINANRTSFTNEVLDETKRSYLSNYVSNNAENELSKSKVSKKLYFELYKNRKPSISFEYLNGLESKSDNGRIVIDASVVEQFLRVKGYSSDDLIKNGSVRSELLTYVSPLIVREMGNIKLNNKLSGGYNPDVREKQAVALLYQAKYTQERYSDSSFKNLFDGLSGVSDYADKVMIVKRNYEKADNSDDFIQTVGIRYYSNLPSASMAKSEILLSITREIERRNSLSLKEKENIDKYAIFGDKEVYSLTPYEVTNYIRDIKTDVLIKLQKELTSSDNFSSRLGSLITNI